MGEELPHENLPDAAFHRIKASRTGFEYDIHIMLPSSYADSGVTYPSLLVLDSHALLGISAETVRLLAHSEQLPELILVGIGFAGAEKDVESYQARDYLPAQAAEGDRSPGGSAEFLHFLAADLVPYVGAHYRVDRNTAGLLGCSLSGTFALYALLHQPTLFRRWLIGSPWTDPGDTSIFGFESEYATKHSDLPAEVFLSAGSLEPGFVLENVRRLEKCLRNRNYSGLRLHTEIFDGETHLSAVPQNISKGLKVLFR